jgi:serine/threonine protein kinase/WD40 repeat protein
MESQREKIKAIFLEAVEKTGADRQAFLQRACGDDAPLLAEVEEFLLASEKAGDFLASPTQAPPGITHPGIQERPGTRIGPYKLLEQIGEGGFGLVFMAEQESPMRRRVALKIIKLGMDTKQVIARFEAERQALAIMDHPNIAKVFEAGATETGRPYFVMELVRGMPITEYCDSQKLTTRQRVELFTQVCHAIQHAHQKGVIHRDIKPNNVLVTMHDDKAVPKVIDFGIAKATGQNLTEKTLFTEFRQFVGTPAYMSPEQAQLNELDVDTRSDIYSLGVLLYELLTGTTPFDPKELRAAAYDEIRRIIREVDPPKPSTRISSLGETLPGVAEHRRIEPAQLVHSMKGELDWIVMKAMEKDRTRRYETANGLSLDIQRYLDDEPVLARPQSSAYRFRKLVTRNKVAFGAAAAVSLALVLGVCFSTWGFVRASRARDIAQAARADEATQRHIADDARRQADQREFAARQRAYASDMHLLQHAIETNDLGRAQDLLDRQRPQNGEQDLRGWEWRYLWQFCKSDALYTLGHEPSEIRNLVVSPDGKWLAAGQLWDGGLVIWDLETKQPVARLRAGDREVRPAFSPDSQLLAFSSVFSESAGSVRLRDMQSGRIVGEIPLPGDCRGLAFSKDGRTLATCVSGSTVNEVALWQIPQCTKLKSYATGPLNSYWREGAAFGRDATLAVIPLGEGICMMDLVTGKTLWTAPSTVWSLYSAPFSPDGKTLAYGSADNDSAITLRDVDTGKPIGTLEGHGATVTSLLFLPDGKTLASASGDQTVRLWDVPSRRLLSTLRGHRSEVWSLAFCGARNQLFSGCKDGTVMAWNPAPLPPKPAEYQLPIVVRYGYFHKSWEFDDDGSLVVAEANGRIGRWKPPGYDLVETLAQIGANVRFVRFSHTFGQAALGLEDGHVQIWDLKTHSMTKQFLASTRPTGVLYFGAQDKTLLTTHDGDDTIYEWDLATLRPTRSWLVQGSGDNLLYYLLMSPDAKSLVALDYSGHNTQILDLVTGSQTPGDMSAQGLRGGKFSPDGTLLAATSGLGFVKLWDWPGRREIATLGNFSHGAHSAGFTPDDKRLATSSDGDRPIRIWDVPSHEELIALDTAHDLFDGISFSPDGNVLAASTNHGAIHIWRAPSWGEIEAAEAKQKADIQPP